MEARSELRGARMSKGLVVVIAVCVTLALGITAGVVAKNFKAAPAATQTHIVQGLGGPVSDQPARRGGAAIVSGSDYVPGSEYAIPSALAPDAGPTTARLLRSQSRVASETAEGSRTRTSFDATRYLPIGCGQ